MDGKREILILGRRARFEFPRVRRVASGGLCGGCADSEDCSGNGSVDCDSDAAAFESSTGSMRSMEAAQTGGAEGWLGGREGQLKQRIKQGVQQTAQPP